MEESQLLEAVSTFDDKLFSTFDFVLRLQKLYPDEWKSLQDEYGVGGKGAGKPYSVYSRVSAYLNKLSNHEKLFKLDYRKSPEEWGSHVIRYWCAVEPEEDHIYPDQIDDDDTVNEGAKTRVTVNRYERDRSAREKCIEKYGVTCYACGFDFEKKYGEHGAGFIHVHHIKPVSEIGREYKLNPKQDLIPLCPNCHAMIHRQVPALSIDELIELINNKA